MPIVTSQKTGQPSWRFVFLAALVTALTTILGTATASAATTAGAETRVGAPSSSVDLFVGASDQITAGQHLGEVLSGPEIVVATGVAAKTARSGGDTVDLYRAVGVREYDSVMKGRRFEPSANSLEGRQFAQTMDEAITYADTDLSKVAILKATVDRSAMSGIDFSTRIDPFIFKNGVFTVQPGAQSDAFHAGLRGIDHVY